MGRRIKSTKSGKYINPTDQARKEARKRELKKNKKQRLIVRVAVLKGKDPLQLIADMERLDRMEYDFYNPPPLNEKVLKDKRRKLKETWDRICKLYIKEDKDKYLELKRMEGDYDARRNELVKQYEAIKSAQEVNVEDIPLPSTIPLATESSSKGIALLSILKNTKAQTKQPPGCPPGLPPSLKELISEYDEDDSCDSEAEVELNKKIRFSDEVDDKNKDGSNLQKFLQEIEQLSTDKLKDSETNDQKNTHDEDTSVPTTVSPQTLQNQPALPNMFFGSPTVQPAPPILMQPPIRPPNVSLVHPPPQIPIPTPLIHAPGQVVRLPVPPHSSNFFGTTSNYLNNKKGVEKTKQAATIEARPQLRNLSADSTKFTPLALRVRREEKQTVSKKPTTKPIGAYGMVHSYSNRTNASSSSMIPRQSSKNTSVNKDKTNSKDDAYEQFMKEMNGLI